MACKHITSPNNLKRCPSCTHEWCATCEYTLQCPICKTVGEYVHQFKAKKQQARLSDHIASRKNQNKSSGTSSARPQRMYHSSGGRELTNAEAFQLILKVVGIGIIGLAGAAWLMILDSEKVRLKAAVGEFIAKIFFGIFLIIAAVFSLLLVIAFLSKFFKKKQTLKDHQVEVAQANEDPIKNEKVQTSPAINLNINWDSKDPYEILGISNLASAPEIKEAYHKLIEKWHPDKLSALAPELQNMAEEKSKIINWAYNECSKRTAV